MGSTLFLPTGQRNKLGLVSLATFATSPYYPQSWYGEDINDASPPVAPSWETCAFDESGAANGSPANCGTHGGDSSAILSYPVDVAVGSGGSLFVLNNGGGASQSGNDVEVLTAGQSSAYLPSSSFGSGGSGNGQLNQPTSIVRDDSSGDIFIADAGNNRISEFAADAGWAVLLIDRT